MAKPTFKMLLASWTLDTVEKRIISFNAENLRSVGQRVESYRPSNFENDSTEPGIESGPTDLGVAGAAWHTFFETSGIDR